MDRGLDWYRRDPRAMIDAKRAANDSQGMTMAQAAIYDLVTDLIYEGAGQTPNNPKYFASHFSDMSTRAARLSVEFLIGIGKLETNSRGFLSNSRAKLEAKARQVVSEARAKAGEKGGKNSAKARKKSNENNDGGEANASSKTQPEKSRVESDKKSPSDSSCDPENSHSMPLFGGQQKKARPKAKVDEAFSKMQGAGGVSDDAVRSYLAYRKTTKAKGTTPRAAQMVAKELIAISQRGGDPDEALDMAQLHGWQGLKADWYFNKRGQDNGNRFDNGGSGGGAAGTRRPANGGHHDALLAGFGQAALNVERGTRSDGFGHSENFHASDTASDRGQGGADPG